MKKLFFLTVLFILLTVSYVCAATDYIRIGLQNKISAVTNGNIMFGYEKNSEFISCGNIISSNGVSVSSASKYFLCAGQTFDTYEAAKQFSGALSLSGYEAVPALFDINSWFVYIGGFSSENETNSAKLNIGLSTTLIQSFNRVSLSVDGKTAVIFANPVTYGQIRDANGAPIVTGDRSYRGRIEFNLLTGTMAAVNILPIDEYLYSAVPSEMPSSWHAEALKAQATAMRTYTQSRRNAHISSGYELCDVSHCQVYKGSTNEAVTTTTAVNSTAGVMIYYNNAMINAVYHSSSGGHTEDSENVWNNKIDYLRGVKEINEPTGKIWSRTFALSDITTLLGKNNVNIGTAKTVRIGNVSDAGRVTELIIEGTTGTKSIMKEEIRTFFSPSSGGSLDSRNFVIGNAGIDTSIFIQGSSSTVKSGLTGLRVIGKDNNILAVSSDVPVSGSAATKIYTRGQLSSSGSSDEIIFTGKGWGHGVGMSQHGANGMAQLGYKYDEILKHYYTGVQVY